MIEGVVSFLKILLKLAPEMAPKVRTAIDQWASIHKIPTDRIIEQVGADHFAEIDAGIDAMVDDLDIPEK